MTDSGSRQNTTFPSGGSTAHGYLALPDSGTGPGVVVIQEWWGLTDHIADVCDRLAGRGSSPWPPTCSAARPPTTPTRRAG
jgi:carboxymethylenebutenolidase